MSDLSIVLVTLSRPDHFYHLRPRPDLLSSFLNYHDYQSG